MTKAKGERCGQMPERDIFWYVLQTRTGSENKIVELLKERLDVRNCHPFVPVKTHIFRRRGEESLFQKICFPGHVFIESIMPANEFMRQAYPIIFKLKNAYRFLYYENRYDIAMWEKERCAFLETGKAEKQTSLTKYFHCQRVATCICR